MSGLRKSGFMKSERLFKLLLYLLNHQHTTANKLAAEFDVSTRTIYRDIDTLSVSGIPIYTTAGNTGGIHLMPHFTMDRALLTKQELNNVTLALRALQTLPFITSETLLPQLSAFFNHTSTTEQWLEISFTHWGDGQLINNKLYSQIKMGITNRNQMQLSYATASGEFTHRTIEPLKLVFQQRDWYLYAFCLLRNDFRFFKINRIVQIKQTKTFCIHDYQNYSALAAIKPKPQLSPTILFQGVFDKSAFHAVYDAIPSATTDPISTDKLRITATLPDDSWLRSFLLSFGNQLKIERPISLYDEIKQMHLAATLV